MYSAEFETLLLTIIVKYRYLSLTIDKSLSLLNLFLLSG